MQVAKNPEWDDTDWAILDALQRDGRLSVAALARVVHLSATATTERLTRLQDAGVITGFAAMVDPGALGLGLTAFIRMRTVAGTRKAFVTELGRMPSVIECHHVTGEDCYLIKVVARDMADLERLTERIAGYGETITSVVYSEPVSRRPITRDLLAR